MEEGLRIWLEGTFERIDKKLEAECWRVGERIPYTTRNGLYETDMREENLAWWTNGFWAGMLWQMYHATGNEEYCRTARYSEEAFDKALEEFEGLHHDVGFQFLHTAVADYRLTGSKRSRTRGLHGAALLAGRFNGNGNYIRAWNKDLPGWLIVDCLMNIPLLYWAGEETGDPRFAYVADQHAHTAMRLLVREDGSCNHIAVCDPATGELLELPGGQGYGAGSSCPEGRRGLSMGLLWPTGIRERRSIWIRPRRWLIILLPMWLPPVMCLCVISERRGSLCTGIPRRRPAGHAASWRSARQWGSWRRLCIMTAQ